MQGPGKDPAAPGQEVGRGRGPDSKASSKKEISVWFFKEMANMAQHRGSESTAEPQQPLPRRWPPTAQVAQSQSCGPQGRILCPSCRQSCQWQPPRQGPPPSSPASQDSPHPKQLIAGEESSATVAQRGDMGTPECLRHSFVPSLAPVGVSLKPAPCKHAARQLCLVDSFAGKPAATGPAGTLTIPPFPCLNFK